MLLMGILMLYFFIPYNNHLGINCQLQKGICALHQKAESRQVHTAVVPYRAMLDSVYKPYCSRHKGKRCDGNNTLLHILVVCLLHEVH
jgi:hypothetical protein